MHTTHIILSLLTTSLSTAAPLDLSLASLSSSLTDALFPSPSLPQSTLSSPPSNLSLKYIALGLGTQNYTCTPSTSSSTPSKPIAVGAKATLYDMTASMSTPLLSKAAANNTCDADKYKTSYALPELGMHYFNALGQPTFDLSTGSKSAQYPQGMFLQAKKVGAATAPSDACTGRDGSSAVPWLELIDNGSGVSRGISAVYRVVTTGGSAPASCDGVASGAFTQDYAAQYWFYG